MRTIVVATLAAAALALASCGPAVSTFGSGDETPPPSDAPLPPSDSQPPQGAAPAGAFAWKGSDGAFPTELGSIDADALVLSVSNVPLACKGLMPDPFVAGPCVPEDEWQLLLAIPPALDRPGLIDLGDPRIQFASSVRFAGCVGAGAGSGHGTSGVLHILSSDDASVTFQLNGSEPQSALEGVLVAERCGTPPPPFVPRPAVAVRGSALAGNPSSGTGPTADADTLYLFLGDVPGTCANPQPVSDCSANRQMVLGLPPALQVAGEVPLTDPTVDAIYRAAENSCSTATPDGGTLTVSNVSETSMALHIYGSGQAGFDGDYAVTVCP